MKRQVTVAEGTENKASYEIEEEIRMAVEPIKRYKKRTCLLSKFFVS